VKQSRATLRSQRIASLRSQIGRTDDAQAEKRTAESLQSRTSHGRHCSLANCLSTMICARFFYGVSMTVG
jgi:hypothetical protein